MQGPKQENKRWDPYLLSLPSVNVLSPLNWTIAVNHITHLITWSSISLPPTESASTNGGAFYLGLIPNWYIFSLSYRMKPTLPILTFTCPCILFSVCISNLSFNGWLFQTSLLLEKSSHFYLIILLSPGMFFLHFFSIPHNIQITANTVLSCPHFTSSLMSYLWKWVFINYFFDTVPSIWWNVLHNWHSEHFFISDCRLL